MVKTVFYKRRFAFRPQTCSDGTKVWLKSYFDKFESWNYAGLSDEPNEHFGHNEFVESITTDEYIVRKLAETL